MLFIAGDEDTGTPGDNMRVMHGLVGGSEFVVLSPAGHISNMEQPEAHTAALRKFLS